MAEEKKNLKLIDYFVLLVKWKHILIPVLLVTMLISYLTIYFFIKEEFEATALIIPSQEQTMGGIAGLLSGIQGLPVDLGGQLGNSEMTIYSTIIYSRTFLNDVIKKFDLIREYEISKSLIDYKELARRQLASYININVNDDYAYEISVRAYTPEKAALMTNYVIEKLNQRIVELKVQKSRENREFLEGRLQDVRNNLKIAEDSLKYFQESSGMLMAEEQVKDILTTYTELESQLVSKQIEKSILEKINPSSPQLQTVSISVEQFKKKLNQIKSGGLKDSPLISYSSIPEKTMEYFRLFREVEINNEILKFILPLYEQAKFDEQKEVPIFQIVDYAVPPAKKVYPPRTVLTLAITFMTFIFCLFFIIVKENDVWQNESKYIYIRQNLFRWKARG